MNVKLEEWRQREQGEREEQEADDEKEQGWGKGRAEDESWRTVQKEKKTMEAGPEKRWGAKKKPLQLKQTKRALHHPGQYGEETRKKDTKARKRERHNN